MLIFVLFLLISVVEATTWKQPPEEILEVLHAPQNPSMRLSPDAAHGVMMRSVSYPPLADKAAEMLPLAGIRVDARTNGYHGRYGYSDPVLLRIENGQEVPIELGDATVLDVKWSHDSRQFALVLKQKDHIGLWVGNRSGKGRVVPKLKLNPLLASPVQWLPDNQRLLVHAIPNNRRGPPAAPVIPAGPETRSGNKGRATSTYEARDLLKTAHDDALFTYYTTRQLGVLSAADFSFKPVSKRGVFTSVRISPNGKFLLLKTLERPWSHRMAWRRFAHSVEVWTLSSNRLVHTVTQQPIQNSVPIHGVPTGPRSVGWRANAPATLVWLEAQDGGDWSTKVPHRDHMKMLAAPFRTPPRTVFRATHRIYRWWWRQRGGVLVQEYERARRWVHVSSVNVDRRTSSPLFDLSVNDRYNHPGQPVTQVLPNGHRVLLENAGAMYFAGRGESPTGDRPFLDRRYFKSPRVHRLFRSHPKRYERFLSFIDPQAGTFLIQSESSKRPPNVRHVTLGKATNTLGDGAQYDHKSSSVTIFKDPTPILRDIERRIITYKRDDGVPLSFTLYLPPGYKEGERLPTVVYAYPREFSDAKTAGQVRGSENTFTRIRGPSHLFFLLQGYAVLHNTRMPVIGDPDTAYDTFVEQLVSGAKAAVDEAVRLGVTDPDRVGVMGHSHGGLMTVTLLAHSDLFKAGIARSGAYNHTIRPFGFQSERRTLWQARDNYLNLSPVMHAPKINEPLLLIHGAIDENPGTIPFQSERLFEAVRGVGGHVRWVSLPFEGHGYRAKESVEHVLWEQIRWFNRHVRDRK